MRDKKILILGATGTLGHKLLQIGNELNYPVYGTARKFNPLLSKIGISKNQLFCGIDVEKNIEDLGKIIAKEKFGTVVNCIGAIPQKKIAPVETIYCNSLFPHKIARICTENKSRLIHISTDCVFSGRKGMYTEDDEPDATALYGKSKELGEISYDGHLTIRTSFIGREISKEKAGLLEWFLSQSGEINGFSKAIWSGLTTTSLSRAIYTLVYDFPDLSGLVHLSNQPIDKYSLLLLCTDAFNKDIVINKDDQFKCDRSLKISKALEDKISIPSYEEMIAELAHE